MFWSAYSDKIKIAGRKVLNGMLFVIATWYGIKVFFSWINDILHP
jgi:hypothetical protein